VAALHDPTAGAGSERWLIEARPVAVVSSASVLAELVRDRRPRRGVRIVGFGDPDYPVSLQEQDRPGLRGVTGLGLELYRLPATRLEVETLGELWPDGTSLWLGSRATEERAKAVGRETTIIHFATHGAVDEGRPLESALVLTLPEEVPGDGENGILQAWEVFESVRIDADLVTLSACDTALGKEVAGEGIVGLTRAFQYAGARTVLASLWSVADESTAELMARFYGGLKSGLPKDEALRQAQLAFIRGPVMMNDGDDAVERDLSHPYFWAAFQLHGDWR
jgi:CHAT domain-containing protein